MDRKFPSELPSEFPSGMGRRLKNPATSAAVNERPLERHRPSKAAIYRFQLRTKRRSLRAPRSCTPAEFEKKKLRYIERGEAATQ